MQIPLPFFLCKGLSPYAILVSNQGETYIKGRLALTKGRIRSASAEPLRFEALRDQGTLRGGGVQGVTWGGSPWVPHDSLMGPQQTGSGLGTRDPGTFFILQGARGRSKAV